MRLAFYGAVDGIPTYGRLLIALSVFWAAGASAMPMAPNAPDQAWLFDDGAGATASDAVGAHDGALQGGAGWDSATPFATAGNFSIRFSGNGDQVEMASLNRALEGLSAFTLSMWVRSDALDQDRAFWSGQDPGNADLFNARYDDRGWLSGGSTHDLLKIGLHVDGVNYQYESGEGLQTTSWQHVAVVWASGAGLQLYTDGVLDTPTAETFGNLTGTLSDQPRFLIGNGAKANWRGNIDEVAVWGSALDGDEVAWLAGNSLANLSGVSPVPEPLTSVQLAIGLIGLAILGRRR